MADNEYTILAKGCAMQVQDNLDQIKPLFDAQTLKNPHFISTEALLTKIQSKDWSLNGLYLVGRGLPLLRDIKKIPGVDKTAVGNMGDFQTALLTTIFIQKAYQHLSQSYDSQSSPMKKALNYIKNLSHSLKDYVDTKMSPVTTHEQCLLALKNMAQIQEMMGGLRGSDLSDDHEAIKNLESVLEKLSQKIAPYIHNFKIASKNELDHAVQLQSELVGIRSSGCEVVEIQNLAEHLVTLSHDYVQSSGGIRREAVASSSQEYSSSASLHAETPNTPASAVTPPPSDEPPSRRPSMP